MVHLLDSIEMLIEVNKLACALTLFPVHVNALGQRAWECCDDEQVDQFSIFCLKGEYELLLNRLCCRRHFIHNICHTHTRTHSSFIWWTKVSSNFYAMCFRFRIWIAFQCFVLNSTKAILLTFIRRTSRNCFPQFYFLGTNDICYRESERMWLKRSNKLIYWIRNKRNS